MTLYKFDYYFPPLIGGGIKRCFCLTFDVCRVHRAQVDNKEA